MKPKQGAPSAATAPTIDMSGFGLLQVANAKTDRRCQRHGDKVELIFDTGIVVYVPEALLDTMVFFLEPDYVEEEIDRRAQ